MPTVLVLRTGLNTMVSDSIAPAIAMGYYNEAQRDLASIARITSKQVLPFVKTDRSVTLATNFIEIRTISVEFTNGMSLPLTQINPYYLLQVVENQTIEWVKDLPDSGNFVIRGYRLPIDLINDSGISEIPEAFHDALNFYSAASYFDTDDEPGLASRWQARYDRHKLELDRFTKNRGVTGSAYYSNPKPPWLR